MSQAPWSPPAQPAATARRRSTPVLVPHLFWEPLLLIATIVVVVIAATRTSLWDGDLLWWMLASYGLLATGLALSLRTGALNLAMIELPVFSATLYEVLSDGPMAGMSAVLVVLGVTLLIGLVMGLITGLLTVPAWAVSLGGFLVVAALGVFLTTPGGFGLVSVPEFLRQPYPWLVAFLVFSLLGGIIFAIPAFRRLGVHRAGAEPRFSGRYLFASIVGLSGSSLLAGMFGLSLLSRTGTNDFLLPSLDGLQPLLLALAAVLLGGVGVHGGRGGILGTILGVTFMVVLTEWVFTIDSAEQNAVARYLVPAIVIVFALLVGRVLEAIAPSRPAEVAATPAPDQPPVPPPPPAAPMGTVPPAAWGPPPGFPPPAPAPEPPAPVPTPPPGTVPPPPAPVPPPPAAVPTQPTSPEQAAPVPAAPTEPTPGAESTTGTGPATAADSEAEPTVVVRPADAGGPPTPAATPPVTSPVPPLEPPTEQPDKP